MEKVIIDQITGKSPFTLPKRPGYVPQPQKEVPYEWHKERSNLKVVCSTESYDIWVMSI